MGPSRALFSDLMYNKFSVGELDLAVGMIPADMKFPAGQRHLWCMCTVVRRGAPLSRSINDWYVCQTHWKIGAVILQLAGNNLCTPEMLTMDALQIQIGFAALGKWSL
jgi:hypothetical protein